MVVSWGNSVSTPSKWTVAIAVMVPTFIEILDMTVVNVSLHHIQGSLSAGLDEVTWVLTSYLVSNAVIIPISGWLANRIGRRRYLLVSIALFTFSSLACGAAAGLSMLLIFRVLQGMGGGGLQPLSNAILLETFPPKEHGTAMAIFGMGIVLAPILGPILGGWVTDNWSWRWIFYINIPVGILSILLTLLFIHDPPYIGKQSRKVDYRGIALLVVGIGSLQLVLDRGERLDWFSSSFILRLSILSAVCLLLFLVNALRTKDPVVDLRVFRHRSFAAGNVIMFFSFFAFFASIVLLPIYVQNLMGYNSWWAGWVLAPGGVATFLLMPVAGRLMQKVDARKLLFIGIVINGYSLYLMSKFNLEADFVDVMWPRMVQGFGLSFFFVSLAALTVSRIPPEKMGNATAVFNFMRNIGGSFGVAVMTTQLSRRAQFHQGRLVDHLSRYDMNLQHAVNQISSWLGTHLGVSGMGSIERSMGVVYGELNRQAFMLAVNDAFFLDGIFFFATLLLVFLFRRTQPGFAGPGAH